MHTTFGGPGIMFTLVPLFIGIVFVFVIGSILIKAVQGVSEWSSNNSQPVLSENATVVSKRMDVHGSGEHSSTSYYTTFEILGGRRCEFEVSGAEYGLLAEGDTGHLRFQGSRYLTFNRVPIVPPSPVVPPDPVPANLVCEYCRSAIPAGSIKCISCGWTYQPKRMEVQSG